MTGRAFVDTNVWVYAVDSADPTKQERARAVLAPSDETDFVVSAQVLGEFYVTITRKFERRVGEGEAATMLDAIRQLPVVAIDGNLAAEAAETSRAWRIAYWDALILAAARSAGCDVVLSEDLSDHGLYDGIRVENPFRPPRRVSEKSTTAYQAGRGAMARWSDDELDEALGRYESESAASGMTRNAVHS